MILFDKQDFTFNGFLGQKGRCGVKVALTHNSAIDIVVFTNPLNYTGPSVTNSIELIIKEFEKFAYEGVFNSFNESPIFLYLERYADKPNEFTWVSLNENQPSWKEATPEENQIILSYLEEK